jgi:hypothetical protein
VRALPERLAPLLALAVVIYLLVDDPSTDEQQRDHSPDCQRGVAGSCVLPLATRFGA